MVGKQIKTLFENFMYTHNNYKLIDIVINYFYVIKGAHIGLILTTEKEKEKFCTGDFNQCTKELSKKIEESNIIEVETFVYSVFSKEEIDEKYQGSYYYAMH